MARFGDSDIDDGDIAEMRGEARMERQYESYRREHPNPSDPDYLTEAQFFGYEEEDPDEDDDAIA